MLPNPCHFFSTINGQMAKNMHTYKHTHTKTYIPQCPHSKWKCESVKQQMPAAMKEQSVLINAQNF